MYTHEYAVMTHTEREDSGSCVGLSVTCTGQKNIRFSSDPNKTFHSSCLFPSRFEYLCIIHSNYNTEEMVQVVLKKWQKHILK